jgi:hypothetical protein
LNHLYETLLILLETAGLPETRNRLLETWTRFQSEKGGISKTTFYPEYDFLESKPFTYLEILVTGLSISAGKGSDSYKGFEIAMLEKLLRRTSVLLHKRGITPKKELDVQDVMHDYLAALFTDYRHPVHINGIIHNFEPDGGILSLKTAIEFKFAATESEVSTALNGIFEDISGYKGSSDWTRFYTVVYQTKSFESEDRFRSEMVRSGARSWTPILVTGAGTRSKKKMTSSGSKRRARHQ